MRTKRSSSPARVTLFDFMPSNVMKKNGTTRKNDKKAVVELRSVLGTAGRDRSKAR